MKSSDAKTSRSIGEMNQHLREGQLDHEDRVSFVSPLSTYLTSWISGRDSCLVGVSCHSPRNLLVISGIASMHHFRFQLILKWGCWNPSTKCIQLGSINNIFNEPKCPLEKFMIFVKVKTSAKNDEHISMSFLDFWINSYCIWLWAFKYYK